MLARHVPTSLLFAISLQHVKKEVSDAVDFVQNARSFKTAIYGTFVRRMRKDVRYCFDKNHDER